MYFLLVVAILCPLFGNIDVFPSFLILCRFKKDICVAEKGNILVVLLKEIPRKKSKLSISS